MAEDAHEQRRFTVEEVSDALEATLLGRQISLWLDPSKPAPAPTWTPYGHIHPEDAGHLVRWFLEELLKRS